MQIVLLMWNASETCNLIEAGNCTAFDPHRALLPVQAQWAQGFACVELDGAPPACWPVLDQVLPRFR
jgi:hypothetical protein